MSNPILNHETHTYTIDGNAVKISVTQLLKKHGLSPNYSYIPTDILLRAADKGTLVHKEVEDYIKTNEIGFTEEIGAFISLCKKTGIKPLRSEFSVGNLLVAGTADLSGECDDGTKFLADVKTTQQLHTDSIAWQLSILEYLEDTQYDHFYGVHLRGEEAKLVEIHRIPREEIEKLLECERNNELYKAPLPVLNDEMITKMQMIADYNEKIAAFKEKIDQLTKDVQQSVIKEMERTNTKSFENEIVKITYIAPTMRESIDSKKLKEEMPDVAAKYTKCTQVKASLRITTRI